MGVCGGRRGVGAGGGGKERERGERGKGERGLGVGEWVGMGVVAAYARGQRRMKGAGRCAAAGSAAGRASLADIARGGAGADDAVAHRQRDAGGRRLVIVAGGRRLVIIAGEDVCVRAC